MSTINNNKIIIIIIIIIIIGFSLFKDNNPDYGAYPNGCIFKINDGDRRKQFELAKKNGTCLSDHMSCIMNFEAI